MRWHVWGEYAIAGRVQTTGPGRYVSAPSAAAAVDVVRDLYRNRVGGLIPPSGWYRVRPAGEDLALGRIIEDCRPFDDRPQCGGGGPPGDVGDPCRGPYGYLSPECGDTPWWENSGQLGPGKGPQIEPRGGGGSSSSGGGGNSSSSSSGGGGGRSGGVGGSSSAAAGALASPALLVLLLLGVLLVSE